MNAPMKVLTLALLFCSTSASNAIRGTADFERMLQSDLGTTCGANPVCAKLGLEGECCPSADGQYLDCCNRSCQRHAECNSLAENCCPTLDGVELDCCDHQAELAAIGTGRSKGASCSAYDKCAHLADDCCPTAEGVMLDCCVGL